MNLKRDKITIFLCVMLLSMGSNGCTIDGGLDSRSETISNKETEKKDAFQMVDADAVRISCDERNVDIVGKGVAVNEDVISISSAGTYVFTGKYTGKIVIDADKSEEVRLVLDGFVIKNETGAAIVLGKADRFIISLVEGTENEVSDGSAHWEDGNGAIVCNSDLTLNGTGKLSVQGNYKDAIITKGDLRIIEGDYQLIATDSALRGNDSVSIFGGTYHLTSKKDSITSPNETGCVYIEDGTFVINSEQDGIFAETSIHIVNGSVNIDSFDDAIYSNDTVLIDNGDITISTDGNGIHSDKSLIIEQGKIDVRKSYEGLEALEIIIENGEISIVASDDGINASNKKAAGNAKIVINGGSIYVNAQGDGLDANGDIIQNGGIVVVDGPSDSMNGALDYDETYIMNGGSVIAVGISSMFQNISEDSEVYALSLGGEYDAGTNILVKDAVGKVYFDFTSAKKFGSAAIASEEFEAGSEITVYVDGKKVETVFINEKISDVGAAISGLSEDGH